MTDRELELVVALERPARNAVAAWRSRVALASELDTLGLALEALDKHRAELARAAIEKQSAERRAQLRAEGKLEDEDQ